MTQTDVLTLIAGRAGKVEAGTASVSPVSDDAGMPAPTPGASVSAGGAASTGGARGGVTSAAGAEGPGTASGGGLTGSAVSAG